MVKFIKSKLGHVVLSLAMIAMFAVSAGVAKAAYESLSSCPTMSVGSSAKSCVMTLQTALNDFGYNAGAVDGSFGSNTARAVRAFQAAKPETGISDGIVGMKTKAALMGSVVMSGACGTGYMMNPAYTTANASYTAMCVPAVVTGACPAGYMMNPAYTTANSMYTAMCVSGTGINPTGPLMGGAGSISATTLLSTYNNEVVNESETANVLAFEVKADNGSDLNLSSVRLTLNHTGTGSYRLDRYASKVSVWYGSTKVGTLNASDFFKNSDNSYTANISLTGVIIKAAMKGTLTFDVTANTTIDTVDQDSGNTNWDFEVNSIRYNDATGVVLTETPGSNVIDQSVGFASLSTSGDLELKLTEGTGNPTSGVVEVSESTSTDNVTMLVFKLQAQGGAMTITDLESTLTAVGVTDISQIASDFTLWKGTDTTPIASYDASVSDVTGTAGILEFTDINGLTLAAGSTTTFTIKAKIKEIATGSGVGTAFDQGDTLKVDFLNADLIDTTCTSSLCTVVEDVNTDIVVAGDRSGSVTGNAQSFYSEGVIVALVSKTATKTTSSDPATTTDSGTYVINFDVTAVGADMYIDKSSVAETTAGTADTTAGQGVEYYVSKNGTAGNAAATKQTAPSSILSADGSTTNDTATAFKVNEGDTRHFHITVNFSLDFSGADAAGFYRVNLGSINWDNESSDTTPDFFYTFNLGDYQTPDLSLDDYSL